MVRDFAAELVAARAVGDWAAHERIWEERRVAGVDADEAGLEHEYAPGDKVMYRGELAEIDSRYEISGDYIVLCSDGLYRSASCLALSRPAGLPDQDAERSALVGGVQVPGTAPVSSAVEQAPSGVVAEITPVLADAVGHLADALPELLVLARGGKHFESRVRPYLNEAIHCLASAFEGCLIASSDAERAGMGAARKGGEDAVAIILRDFLDRAAV